MNIFNVGFLGATALEDNEVYTFDPFVTTGWSGLNSNIGISGGNLNYNIVRNGSSYAVSYDLGKKLSNNKWVLRMAVNITGRAYAGGSNIIGFFGMSDNSSGAATAQNFLGVSPASNNPWNAVYKEGASLAVSAPDLGQPTPTVTKYFEIIRTSSTGMSFAVYDNSDYTGEFSSGTATISAGITDLQYLKICNFESGSGSGTVTGQILNLTIYNNVTSV